MRQRPGRLWIGIALDRGPTRVPQVSAATGVVERGHGGYVLMISRRTVLAASAGLAAAAAVPAVGAAPVAAAGRRTAPAVPDVQARSTRPIGGGVRVNRSDFPLSHLGISWQGPGRPSLRTRTADGWSPWRALGDGCGGKRDRGSSRRSVVLPVPGAFGYEIECRRGSSALAVTELNTSSTSSSRTRLTMPVLSALRIQGYSANVRYLSRAGWGANESLRYDSTGAELFPTAFYPLQTLTVHHTAGINNDPDPAATVRAIYYYDAVTQGWGDMGYHFLIDEAGTVYEGRWSGPNEGPNVTPGFGSALGPDGRLPMVTGAHVTGANSGNMGVVLLGDFTNQLPTPAARRSLAAVLAVLAGVGGLNPTAKVTYVNPVDGTTRPETDTISGHRNWMATQCPGNLFYPELPKVRLETAARMG
ncbi:MAG TPA: peptidoglycan recognition family protein [Micromonospora sp.]